MTTIQTIEEGFEKEFGIHFPPDELKFAKAFIQEQFTELLGEIVGEKLTAPPHAEFRQGVNQAIDDFIQRAAERGFNIQYV